MPSLLPLATIAAHKPSLWQRRSRKSNARVSAGTTLDRRTQFSPFCQRLPFASSVHPVDIPASLNYCFNDLVNTDRNICSGHRFAHLGNPCTLRRSLYASSRCASKRLLKPALASLASAPSSSSNFSPTALPAGRKSLPRKVHSSIRKLRKPPGLSFARFSLLWFSEKTSAAPRKSLRFSPQFAATKWRARESRTHFGTLRHNKRACRSQNCSAARIRRSSAVFLWDCRLLPKPSWKKLPPSSTPATSASN